MKIQTYETTWSKDLLANKKVSRRSAVILQLAVRSIVVGKNKPIPILYELVDELRKIKQLEIGPATFNVHVEGDKLYLEQIWHHKVGERIIRGEKHGTIVEQYIEPEPKFIGGSDIGSHFELYAVKWDNGETKKGYLYHGLRKVGQNG